ncbi:DUF5000 domain-containing lipoprotein [Botryobacter ruber]|uniref:DUF5000 domain-containing lipoprotein n=1 Tax=Botryobacter ruber TaxID=2171629 RepID=UPI000E0C4532|nr:DUF5000 domain-containing lipoprotein [Botryobacter ruber]
MKNIKFILSLFLLASITFYGCEEEFMEPLDKDGTTTLGKAPGPISEPIVENTSGGAKITYALPNDPSLLYVKAVYERNGKTVESKASYFRNFLYVEGLGDTNPREVKLYAVSRAEKASSPISVTVTPLTPPHKTVLSSLDIRESFGGMVVDFLNPASTVEKVNDVVIQVLRWDTALNEWTEVDAHYTGLPDGRFSVRGLEAVETKFGFFVRDKWGNYSDTLEQVMTPIYEEEIDGTKFSYERGKHPVPQVSPLPIGGTPVAEPGNLGSWPFDRMFDGNIGNNGFHSNERNPQPAWFAFDMKQPIRLSRYKVWQRMHDNNSTYFYNHGNPHEWELWGTNTPDDPTSWVRLDHQIMVKPSGLPLGQLSTDDVEIARSGHEYEFPLDVPAVRYIAWKHIDSWSAVGGATGHLHISELRFWGQKQ